MLEETKYKNKPEGKQIGNIQNNMKSIEITIEELANKLVAGCSFRPAFLNGKGNDDWISQQIIALDFDKNTTIDEELDRCKILNILPSFGYTSFSHTEERHKFRLVFCLDEVVSDIDKINNIIDIFKSIFTNADQQTFHLGRLFFGGKSLIYEGGDNTVNISELLTMYMNVIKDRKEEHIDKYYINTYIPVPLKPLSEINYNIQAIKDGNIHYLHSILTPKEIVFETQQEFYDYITQEINLYELLDVRGKSFNCVFHKDNNPSAGIFISNRNQYYYKCFSSNCGFMGNIIRCIERLRNCTRPQAINFIKLIYKINIKETEWQKEQKDLLEENKRMIREGELEEFYPEIYNIIKRYESLIYLLHDIAIDNIYDEKYSDDENNVVFFVGLKKLAEKLNLKSHNKVADRVGLLAFLHILNKLPEDEIPEKYITKAKEIAKKHNHHNVVNFYSIPSYCDSTLQESLERANMYKENNVTMKGWSRELLQRTFGDEIADEIYPQFTHRKITKKSDLRTSDIHSITLDLIETKGYAIEKDIVESLRSIYGKTITEIQIKKSLQEMLDGYDLQRVRANKILKEQYGIANNGYPFIIIRNKDDILQI